MVVDVQLSAKFAPLQMSIEIMKTKIFPRYESTTLTPSGGSDGRHENGTSSRNSHPMIKAGKRGREFECRINLPFPKLPKIMTKVQKISGDRRRGN